MNGLKNGRSQSWKISEETTAGPGMTAAETGGVLQSERPGQTGVFTYIPLFSMKRTKKEWMVVEGRSGGTGVWSKCLFC